MSKTKDFLLAASLALATAFTVSCGGDDGGDDSGKRGKYGPYTIEGEERILEVTGLDKYNGQYVGVDFYPEGFFDKYSSGTSFEVTLEGTCGGANSQDRMVENGKIELTIVDFGSLVDENLKPKDVIVFQPCKPGKYMISLFMVKNKKDLEDDPYKIMNSSHYYTEEPKECVIFGSLGLPGYLPTYDFQGTRSSVDFGAFSKVTEIDPNDPFASIRCMFN